MKEGGEFMDEWRELADLLGNMIAKYIEEIDLDSLPDPDYYILLKNMKDMYRDFMKQKKNRRVENIEYTCYYNS